MTVNERIKDIRETQKRLLKINDDDWVELYIKSEKLENSSIGTIITWEKDRSPNVRYLRFLRREFNYNLAYLLCLIDEPKFTTVVSEKDFPETDHILDALNKHPNLTVAFCKMLLKKIPADVKIAHLTLYSKHPNIYADITNLVDTFEEHPDAFQSNST